MDGKKQITELNEQIVAIHEAVKADPDNEELKNLLRELESAKKELLEVSKAREQPKANPKSDTNLFCSVTVAGKDRVGKIIKDEDGAVRVVFLGVNVVKEFPNTQVKYLTSNPQGIFPGSKMDAVFEADGLWYPCLVVKKMGENKAVIRFDGYKEEQEIHTNFLRPRTATEKELAGQTYVTPAGYKIPEKLKIEEKDSEKTKQAKKRKIEEIKKEQRSERRGDEAETRKKTWQDFKKSVAN